MPSWRVEIQTHDADLETWIGNTFRFTTEEEANDYGVNLHQRWSAVRRFRLVESADDPNSTFRDGFVIPLPTRRLP